MSTLDTPTRSDPVREDRSRAERTSPDRLTARRPGSDVPDDVSQLRRDELRVAELVTLGLWSSAMIDDDREAVGEFVRTAHLVRDALRPTQLGESSGQR